MCLESLDVYRADEQAIGAQVARIVETCGAHRTFFAAMVDRLTDEPWITQIGRALDEVGEYADVLTVADELAFRDRLAIGPQAYRESALKPAHPAEDRTSLLDASSRVQPPARSVHEARGCCSAGQVSTTRRGS